jgi:hypothetical protein
LNTKVVTNNSNFEIYLVKDEKTIDAIDDELADLDLEDEPILTDKDIEQYDWNKHKLTLIKDQKLQDILNEKVYLKVPIDGKPFVVVCDGERIYLGAFWTGLSSLLAPNCPIIISDFSDNDYFQIYYVHNERDTRNDERIYKALKKIDKLKEFD